MKTTDIKVGEEYLFMSTPGKPDGNKYRMKVEAVDEGIIGPCWCIRVKTGEWDYPAATFHQAMPNQIVMLWQEYLDSPEEKARIAEAQKKLAQAAVAAAQKELWDAECALMQKNINTVMEGYKARINELEWTEGYRPVSGLQVIQNPSPGNKDLGYHRTPARFRIQVDQDTLDRIMQWVVSPT